MYVTIELITKQDDTFTVNNFKKETREEAESAYHSILTSAAKGSHKIHAAVILNPEGKLLRSECYKHEAPEPEPEEEVNSDV